MRKQKKRRKTSRKSKLDQLIVIAAAILLAAILNEAVDWQTPVNSHQGMHLPVSQDQAGPPIQPIERFSNTNLPPYSVPTRGRY